MQLTFYAPSMEEALKQFDVSEDQLKFVRSPQENVELAKVYFSRKPVFLVNEEGIPVVFFVLDTEGEFKEVMGVQDAVYVRSFSTDYNHLRQGHAKKALELLPDFVRNHYPDAKYITLIVDEPNPMAKRMYENAGFELGHKIKGERYDGNMMKKKL